MERRKRPPERNDRGEEKEKGMPPLSKSEAVDAMERFKNLTRKILDVPPEKLRAEQERFKRAREQKRGS